MLPLNCKIRSLPLLGSVIDSAPCLENKTEGFLELSVNSAPAGRRYQRMRLKNDQQLSPIKWANRLLHRNRASAFRGLMAAAALHVGLVLIMILVARAAIFPNLIDGYGILAPFRSDSHGYRLEAMALAAILTDSGLSAWAATPSQVHIKVISLLFFLFGPALGPSIISVEPLNLAAYLLILCLVFKLSEEVGNRRVGLIAACTVALWPTIQRTPEGG